MIVSLEIKYRHFLHRCLTFQRYLSGDAETMEEAGHTNTLEVPAWVGSENNREPLVKAVSKSL